MYKQSDIVITEFTRRVKLVLDNRLKKIILFGSRAGGITEPILITTF